ncbi:hypothetical protein PIB30_091939 [Stylosanthes scabra]|uniref:Uncharacterized protein n=1 Tax=Stylosanthes scabra TaxID=79078 RepID=A0ABU6SVM8_9FABA|nr:hypothetical protein [Stylosanthes scabra]
MDQMHTELKAEKDMTTKTKDLVVGLSLDSRANDMYTHWGLQQCIPNYGPTNLEDIPQIPHKIRDNFIFGKPWLEGLIRPTQPGESSTLPQQQAPPQQAPPEERLESVDPRGASSPRNLSREVRDCRSKTYPK